MPHSVGLDVSQKTTAICLVDAEGRRVWRLAVDDIDHIRTSASTEVGQGVAKTLLLRMIIFAPD